MQLIASPAFFLRAVTERAVHELEQEQGTVQSKVVPDAFVVRYPEAIYSQRTAELLTPFAVAFIFRVTFRGQ